MPRVPASNGIRPEIRALAVFSIGEPVTPAEINAHVGTGDYAAKYVSFLNTRYGFTITSQKDGRRVVSYTMIAEPANAADLRASTPKIAKAKAPVSQAPVIKTAKTKSPKKVTAKKSVADIKAANLAKLKEVAERRSKVAKRVRAGDEVAETFGTSGEVATSFSVDTDWDLVDGINLSRLL